MHCTKRRPPYSLPLTLGGYGYLAAKLVALEFDADGYPSGNGYVLWRGYDGKHAEHLEQIGVWYSRDRGAMLWHDWGWSAGERPSLWLQPGGTWWAAEGYEMWTPERTDPGDLETGIHCGPVEMLTNALVPAETYRPRLRRPHRPKLIRHAWYVESSSDVAWCRSCHDHLYSEGGAYLCEHLQWCEDCSDWQRDCAEDERTGQTVCPPCLAERVQSLAAKTQAA
jgi:hypothetical protein